MMDTIHSLLKRQIKRCFGDKPVPKGLQPLIEMVNKAYFDFDSDRNMLERSLEHSSRELLQVNAEMREANRHLQEAQSQLVQSEKMASIGYLSAGIAHEINNPVGFVSNNMEIFREYVGNYAKILRAIEGIKQQVADGNMEKARALMDEFKKLEEEVGLDYMTKDVDKLLEYSLRGIERIRKIVLDLRTFAREGDAQVMELIKVEEVLDSILSIVSSELKHKAELLKEYGATPLIKGNAQRLGQVFINLLINAAQAIEEKGKIVLKTYCQDGWVCLDVTDTGKGIPHEDLRRVFDPFFTTKPVGQGTGLGLSVSLEIVKKHGGDIKVSSKPGQGTTFTVMLPVRLSNEDPIAGEG